MSQKGDAGDILHLRNGLGEIMVRSKGALISTTGKIDRYLHEAAASNKKHPSSNMSLGVVDNAPRP